MTKSKSALAEAFLDCHAEGHQWRPGGTVDPTQAEAGLRPPWNGESVAGRRAVCVSCTGERVRWYTRSGGVVNKYRMADGYYHKRETPDDVAPTRQEYRRDLARRLFGEVPRRKVRRLQSA